MPNHEPVLKASEEFYSPYVDMDTGEVLDTFVPAQVGPSDLAAIATQLATIDNALRLDGAMLAREIERLKAVYTYRAEQLSKARMFLLDCAQAHLSNVKSHKVPGAGTFSFRKQPGKVEATLDWHELPEEEKWTFAGAINVSTEEPAFDRKLLPKLSAIKKLLADTASPLHDFFEIVGKGEIKFDFKAE